MWAYVAQPKKISFYAQKIELVFAGGSSNNNRVVNFRKKSNLSSC
ncbi:MAG: hypothetical protein ACJ708_08695 [Nitrososphaeraceae archaeon]